MFPTSRRTEHDIIVLVLMELPPSLWTMRPFPFLGFLKGQVNCHIWSLPCCYYAKEYTQPVTGGQILPGDIHLRCRGNLLTLAYSTL